jgi:hypothetical protein
MSVHRAVAALGVLAAAGLVSVLAARGSGCTTGELIQRFDELRGDPYPLDAIDRDAPPDARVACDDVELVQHRGSVVRWQPPLEVAPPFTEPLAEFERIAHDLALEFYGRPPKAIRHAGAFACRRVRHRAGRLSEHALGNAVDFVGFDFGPAPRDVGVPDSLPSALDKAFFIRVQRDWQADAGGSAIHARFLQLLIERLEAAGTFRAMLGPAHEFHREGSHFHFDHGPWKIVRL